MINRRSLLVAGAGAALALAPPTRAQAFRAGPDARERLLARLLRIEEDGLDPRWYGVERGLDETALWRAAGEALADLIQGRLPAPANRPDIHREIHRDSRRDPAASPLGPWLQQLVESEEPAQVLDRAARASPDAEPLRRALALARERARGAAWPTIAPGPIDPWQEDARVPALRARLAATDRALAANAGAGMVYDERLQAAVRRFQDGAGLETDGRLGPATIGALNRPASAQVEQLRVALDMRRGTLPPHPSRRVEVSVADFRLAVVEDGRTLLDMAVVVGRPARATPMMTTRLTSVQFNPPWGVPQRLAREDMLPRLRRDPGALAARGFRIFQSIGGELVEIDPRGVNWHAVNPERFPYVIRQDAGEANALGRLKFNMPNGDDIFLHDTPERRLFARSDRAHSSGCIRLERPMELLSMLMSDNAGWNADRAQRLLDSRETRTVGLARVLPIRLHYTSVTVDAAGAVRARADIYGLDAAYARAMDQPRRGTPVAARA